MKKNRLIHLLTAIAFATGVVAFKASQSYASGTHKKKQIEECLSKVGNQTKKPQERNEDEREAKCINDLVVNTSKYRIFVSESEEEGIQEMRKLAKTATFEEMWAYLPEKSLWVEIGIEEKKEKNLMSIRTDIDYLKKLMKENDKLVLYHIHPDSIAAPKIKELLKTQGEDAHRKDISDIVNSVILLELIIPSDVDIGTMIKTTKTYSEINPKGRMKDRIVSTNGITEYNLNEKGRRVFQRADHSAIVLFANVMKRVLKIPDELFISIPEAPPEKRKESYELLNDDFFYIEFRPFKYEN